MQTGSHIWFPFFHTQAMQSPLLRVKLDALGQRLLTETAHHMSSVIGQLLRVPAGRGRVRPEKRVRAVKKMANEIKRAAFYDIVVRAQVRGVQVGSFGKFPHFVVFVVCGGCLLMMCTVCRGTHPLAMCGAVIRERAGDCGGEGSCP